MTVAANAGGAVAAEEVDGTEEEGGSSLVVMSPVGSVGGSTMGLLTGRAASTVLDPSTCRAASREDELPELLKLPVKCLSAASGERAPTMGGTTSLKT